MNIQDKRKTLTVEELRRRYNLDALEKDRKAIKLQKDQLTKVDAELNDFVEITTKNLKELQDQVDGNITTWFFNGVPEVEKEPSSNWVTEEEKINHLGDLYYDQDTGYAYRWAYENNIYLWSKIVDADVVEALAVANAAQDTADSKRRVFVVQPIPPYDIGDIWIKEDTDLYRCRASRSEGNFNTADWVRATNYTDDTVALGTKAELDQFKTSVEENYVTNATLETTTNSITGKVEETYTYVTTVEHQVNDITTTTQTSTGGNNLYITDSLESNAIEYHVEGKSEQDGEPTPDVPVEIKTIPSIRNLFDKNNINYIKGYITGEGAVWVDNNDNVNKTFYIKIKPNTTYTISKKAEKRFRVTTFSSIPAVTTQGNVSYNNNTSSRCTITTGNDDNYLFVYYYASNDYTLTEQEILDSIMIEEGSIAHPYVPYGAWLKTKITGKNLLNQNTIIKGYGLSYGETYVGNERSIIDYLEVKENTDYTAKGFTIIQISYYDKNKEVLSYTPINATETTFTTPNNTKYIRFSFDNTKDYSEMQLEEGTTATEYEAYKEQEVLIDLSKPNLFDKENANILNVSINADKNISTSSNAKTLYIPCQPNTTYTVSKIVSNRFRLATTSDIPAPSIASINYIANDTASVSTITTSSNAKYLCVYYFLNGTDTLTEKEILDSIKIYEGYNDYYELSSIGDTKDLLEIKNGEVVLTKNIGKVVLDGSETWERWPTNNGKYRFALNTSSNILKPSNNNTLGFALCNYYKLVTGNETLNEVLGFGIQSSGWLVFYNEDYQTLDTWKTWLSNNPVSVYYELAEPKQKTLSNTNIPLFDGVNHISLIEDVETNTTIKYYRKTPISNDYVIQQQLDATNSDLADTTNKTNQNASDINKTNNNLNNNYYNKEQIDVINSSTEQIITQIRNEVEATTSATNLQISVLQEQLTNGVTAVKTETGYTFDKDGLKIAKSDSEMNLLLDNDGMEVKRNETEVLTVRSDGVETENLKVRTYFTVGNNTRVEDYKNGTGFFYIGGGN